MFRQINWYEAWSKCLLQKTTGKLGIILWHLIICKKKKMKVKHNFYWIFIQVSEKMGKKLPKILPKPTLPDLKVNTLFSAITVKVTENGFSAQEIRDDSMIVFWLFQTAC